MKQLFSLTMFIIILIFVSCEQGDIESQEVTEVETIDTLTYEWKSYELLKPDCEVSEVDDCKFYNAKYIQITNEKFKFVNDSLLYNLSGTLASTGTSESFEVSAKELLSEYQKESEELEYSMTWQFDRSVDVNYNQKGIFSYQVNNYEYMGGAHGMYGSFGENLDLETAKTLAFYDLVNESDSTALKALGEKYFRENMEIEAATSLNDAGYFWYSDGKFHLNDNFNINKKGITFIYLPYEIAAYAAGMPTFTIPFEDLKPYFTENSPLKRIAKEL